MGLPSYDTIQDNGIDEYFTNKFDAFNGPLYKNNGFENKRDMLKHIINDNLFTQETSKTQCAEVCFKNKKCKQFISASNESGSVCGLLKTEICNNNECKKLTNKDRHGMTFTYYTKK
jgi:hypothetical protein